MTKKYCQNVSFQAKEVERNTLRTKNTLVWDVFYSV